MPGAIWLSYNLFRLVAVVFLAWALVAQYLALADEVTHYNTIKPNNTAINHVSTSTVSTNTSSVSGISSVGVAKIGEMVLTSTSVYTPSTTTGPISRTAFTSASRISATPAGPVQVGLQPLVGSMDDFRRRRRNLKRQSISEGIPINNTETNGMNLIDAEVRGDRIVWIGISRILIAGIIGLCILAQIGIPETILYERLSWIGPQSTPLALGGLKTIAAIESLRAEAKNINLIPAYAVLGIGLFNVLIAVILLYLGRKLPGSPPPPLYFSHTVRLLFWRPAPSFYTAAFSPALPITTQRNTPAPSTRPSDYEVRSNAYEIGLDDTEEDEWEMITKPKPQAKAKMLVLKENDRAKRIEGARDMIPEQDIRNGGYPTFSGNGIGAMNSQVPRGFMEKDRSGMPIALKREAENTTTITNQRKMERLRPGPGQQSGIQPSGSTRRQMNGLNKVHPRIRPESPFEALQTDLNRAETLYRETLPPTILTQPTISRNLSNKSTKSDISAYGGLETEKLPELPSKSEAKVDSRSITASAAIPIPKDTSSRRYRTTQGEKERNRSTPTLKTDGRGRGQSKSGQQRKTELPEPQVKPPIEQTEKEPESIENLGNRSSDPETPITASTSPLTPANIVHAQKGQKTHSQTYVRPKVEVNESSESIKPKLTAKYLRRPEKSKSMVLNSPSAVSSGKAIKRSSSVMESGDKNRGVRFNLSVVEEIPEPEYSPSPASIPPPPSSGLRIPGTNLRLSLPAILSPRPTPVSPQKESEDEEEDAARRVSRASISEMLESLESDIENDRKRVKEKAVKKDNEGMILGGNYLSGGSELDPR